MLHRVRGVTWIIRALNGFGGIVPIITNKHVTYCHVKVGDEIKAHPNGFYNNGGQLINL
ncbi:hypothetical protein ACV566_09850 [Staphylococcus aureus]